MEYAKMLNGGHPLAMKYQVGITFSNAGVPVIANATGDGLGVLLPSTSTGVNVVGVSLDTATYVTDQQTDGTSTERLINIIISPSAIFRALMSGGSTEGTALDLKTVTTTSSSGKDIVTGDNFTFADDGVIWGYDGANAGARRKVSTGDGTDASCEIAFDQDTVLGDNFLAAPWWPLDFLANDITLTTNLYQVNAAATSDAGLLANIIAMELRDISEEGRTNSHLLFVWDDHLLSRTTGSGA